MTRRRQGSLALAFGLVVASTFAPATFAADADAGCELSVSPRSGRPGTEFTFTGSGYSPTILELRQGDKPPTTIDLDLGDDDPFEIAVIAREGDEGPWRAVAKDPAKGCQGVASIDVVLPSTATGGPAADATGREGQLLAFAAVALVFLASVRLLLGRVRPRSAVSRDA